MDINQKITEELGVKRWQVDAAVKLIDEGNTIPFIARYRKEAHGTLDDEQLRKLHERLMYLRNLEEKKEQVLSSIEEQGKLTPELKAAYSAAGASHILCRTRKVRWKKRQQSIYQRKKEWQVQRKQLKARKIFWQNRFPMRRITGRISGI